MSACWATLLVASVVACAGDPAAEPRPNPPTSPGTTPSWGTTQAVAESLDDSHATLLGEAVNDVAGDKVAMAGDVNGDGIQDVLIGAKAHNEPGLNAGAVYVVYGPMEGAILLEDAVRLAGHRAGDFAGGSVAAAGDVNGDGFDDVLVGAKLNSPDGSNQKGAAYLVLGPVESRVMLGMADARFDGEGVGDFAGGTVRGVGDTNGDGFDDVMIGAKSNDANGLDAGVAYLFFGPVSGEQELGLDQDARFLGALPGVFGGGTLDGAGDLNADGLADVAICSCLDDTNGFNAGVVQLLLAPFSGDIVLDSADARWFGEEPEDGLGSLAGVGDLTGDGVDDVVSGSEMHGEGGAVYLFDGTLGGDLQAGDAPARILGSPGQLFGAAVEAAGDTNGDGEVDLVASAKGEAEYAGLVLVFLGPLSGQVDTADADRFWVGVAARDALGADVGGGRDLNGDGLDDLLVGAPMYDEAGTDAGAAFVLLGRL
jgi:hypothetical protein